MPARLVWTPQAREDLLEIYYFIGLDNRSAAERVFDAVQRKVVLLIEHPRLGLAVQRSIRRRVFSSKGHTWSSMRRIRIQMQAASILLRSFDSSMAVAISKISSEKT